VKYGTQTPYLAAFVIVQDAAGKIAFVMRSNTGWMNGHYGPPAGKVEKGESFLAGAVREAKEEIGITVSSKDLEHAITVHRYSEAGNGDAEDMEWVDVYFLVKKYSGEPHNAEPHMHSELAWLDPKNLPKNVIPAFAASIQAWAKGDNYLEYGWN